MDCFVISILSAIDTPNLSLDGMFPLKVRVYATIKQSDFSGDFLAPDIFACDNGASQPVNKSEGSNHVCVGKITTEIAGQLRLHVTSRKKFLSSAGEKERNL